MKNRWKLLLILSLFFMSCGEDSSSNSTTEAEPETIITDDGDTLEIVKENGIINGIVKQTGMGTLSNVTITLTSDSLKGFFYSDTTDNSGSYEIEGILSGKYSLRVSKEDFISKDTTIELSKNETLSIETISLIKIEGWSRCYGGTGWDPIHQIKQASDGGFIIAGNQNSGNGDLSEAGTGLSPWMFKVDNNGEFVWNKVQGTSADEIKTICETSDGGYAFGGFSKYSGGEDSLGLEEDCWIGKLDAAGELLWEVEVPLRNQDHINDIICDDNGSIYAVGWTQTDLLDSSVQNRGIVVKLNLDGDIIWVKSYGGLGHYSAKSAVLSDDGGVVILGSEKLYNDDTDEIATFESWLFKIDSDGEMVWQSSFGDDTDDNAQQLIKTADGNYAFVASVVAIVDYDEDGFVNTHPLVVKIDDEGNKIFSKEILLEDDKSAYISSISESESGKLLLGGYKYHSFPYSDSDYTKKAYFVIGLDANAEFEWSKAHGGSRTDEGLQVISYSADWYLLAGQSSSTDGEVIGFHSSMFSQPDAWIIMSKIE